MAACIPARFPLVPSLLSIGRTIPFCLTKYLHVAQIGFKEAKMEDLKQNSYYSKYAEKIAKLQRESPKEFMEKLTVVKESKASGANSPSQNNGCGFSLPSTKTKLEGKKNFTKRKELNDIMKVDMLRDKSKEEIGSIWFEFYKSKEALSAVIPFDVFIKMEARFLVHKTFLLPLPRKEGYEFFVVQFMNNEAHFTTLINYQAYGENAPENLCLRHFTELAEDKGIVLMVGEYDTNLLTNQEAKCLADQIEMYYANPSKEKEAVLECFTSTPQDFSHQDLIAQLENISIAQDVYKG